MRGSQGGVERGTHAGREAERLLCFRHQRARAIEPGPAGRANELLVMTCAPRWFCSFDALSHAHANAHTHRDDREKCTKSPVVVVFVWQCLIRSTPQAPDNKQPPHELSTPRSRRHHFHSTGTPNVVVQQPLRGHARGRPSLGQDEQDGTFAGWPCLFVCPFLLPSKPSSSCRPPTLRSHYRTPSCST